VRPDRQLAVYQPVVNNRPHPVRFYDCVSMTLIGQSVMTLLVPRIIICRTHQEKNGAPQVQVFRLPMHTPSNEAWRRANDGAAGVESSSCCAAANSWGGPAASSCQRRYTFIDLMASPAALCASPSL
jgi:hypothetical protein